MKATERFKQDIQHYLDTRAANDTLFAKTYTKENKNLDDCITYILNTVQKSGCHGFADEEIFAMAVHYYDEDDIEVGKANDHLNVVVNHTVELTAEEIKEAKEKAMQQAQAEQLKNLKKRTAPVTTKKPAGEQTSLF